MHMDPSLFADLVTHILMYVSLLHMLRFFNIRFTIMEGASLIFDMPETQFAPNGVVRTAGRIPSDHS